MVLAIVRHAKAEKQSATGLDQDRLLTARGVAQAEYLAERFAAHSPRPGAIISSRAIRTRQTAALIARACGLDFDFDARLFIGAPASALLGVLAERASGAGDGFLVLVGHNDQVSDAVGVLTRGVGRPGTDPNDSGFGDEMLELSTGQAVLLSIPRPDAAIGGGEIIDIWRLE